MQMAVANLFTIGYSNHSLERFLALLVRHEVEALVDSLSGKPIR
jgi:hypothetical protein